MSIATLPEVHVHGLWRTSSPWWWLQLRNDRKRRAYYEPFHEYLSHRTHEACDISHKSKPKDKIFRHPATEQHYFFEYPLRESGGVAHYDTRFALEEFVVESFATADRQLKYLQSLRSFASDHSQVPSFKFNRSLLRASWIKRQLGGYHIYLSRNPFSVAKSALSFRADASMNSPKAYFCTCPIMIVGKNRSNPLFGEFAEILQIKQFRGTDFQSELKHYETIAIATSDQRHSDLAVYFWALGIAFAPDYADCIVDTDWFGINSEYRENTCDILAAEAGMTLKSHDFHQLPDVPVGEVSNDVMSVIRTHLGIRLQAAAVAGAVLGEGQRRVLHAVIG